MILAHISIEQGRLIRLIRCAPGVAALPHDFHSQTVHKKKRIQPFFHQEQNALYTLLCFLRLFIIEGIFSGISNLLVIDDLLGAADKQNAFMRQRLIKL